MKKKRLLALILIGIVCIYVIKIALVFQITIVNAKKGCIEIPLKKNTRR